MEEEASRRLSDSQALEASLNAVKEYEAKLAADADLVTDTVAEGDEPAAALLITEASKPTAADDDHKNASEDAEAPEDASDRVGDSSDTAPECSPTATAPEKNGHLQDQTETVVEAVELTEPIEGTPVEMPSTG
eukprot:SAG31_NODE_4366_length_3307_cov_2.745636_4_plen_134_part_00